MPLKSPRYTFFPIIKWTMMLFILCSIPELMVAQGRIPLKNKSFTGALELLPNSKLAEGYSRVKSAYPMGIDPKADPKKWYEEGNQQMRGIMDDAVLFIEWWTKASSPLERSKFDWKSSGYFEVSYVDDKGINKFQRINRYELDKYPNLLQRFDNLRPIDIGFEITFDSGDIPDKDYYNFRDKYKIMEDLGSAGYAVSFTKTINSNYIALKPSGEHQEWLNPGLLLGGWDSFLNIPEKYKDKESRLIELFKLGNTLKISSFKISKIKWKISDFIYIAKKFEDYKTGKDKPTAFDEVEEGKKEAKAGDGFWDDPDLLDGDGDPYYDQTARKYGIKTKKNRIVTQPLYDNIVKSMKGKYFIASKGNTVFVLNPGGRVIHQKLMEKNPRIGACNDGNVYATNSVNERVENYSYEKTYGETSIFNMSGLKGNSKWFYFSTPLSLTVSSGSSTAEERAEWKRQWEEKKAALRAKYGAELEAKGYKRNGNTGCD